MLCELCQVGALLFILLLCPEQNFWDLPRKKRRVGKYHTLKWDFCLKIRSRSLWSQPFADTSSAVSYNPTGVLGELVGNTRDYGGGCVFKSLPYRSYPIFVSVPQFYRRVQHLGGSAARLFRDCGNHAGCLACRKQG